ncbi:MAG TPA: NUDIX hydrolase, partial [Gammaproteobacteria bacterium]|nr:NUDIX hydrolase [Gammaproteobacteria bacterium]
MYGDLSKTKAEEPATPAATVVLLRDTDSGPEVLMLKKNARIDFGGMWVFPGGRIDEEDYPS